MTKAAIGVLLVSFAFAGACTAQERSDRGQQPAGSAARPLQNDVPTSTGARMDTDPTTVPRRDSKGTPAGPHESERGNTPPGMSRAGEGPASGTIVDPANVTRQPKP